MASRVDAQGEQGCGFAAILSKERGLQASAKISRRIAAAEEPQLTQLQPRGYAMKRQYRRMKGLERARKGSEKTSHRSSPTSKDAICVWFAL